MAATIRTWKGLKIYDFGKNEVAIVAHGNYTPKRNALMVGSGKSTATIPVVFYVGPNHATINCGRTLIEGTGSVVPYETAPKDKELENYRLKQDPDFERGLQGKKCQEPVMDYITVSPVGKTHLNDVWDAIRAHGLISRYKKLHFVACRVNKLTFDVDSLPIGRKD